LQEAIEAALDISAHLIAEQGVAVPDDYYGGFIGLPLRAAGDDSPPDAVVAASASSTPMIIVSRRLWRSAAPGV